MSVTARQSSGDAAEYTKKELIRAGMIGGVVGGVVIWIYEALVWVWAQGLMPLHGIPRNATGLVFGKDFQEASGFFAYVIGTGIHFIFSFAWGVLFALIWPYFRRRGWEVTLVAFFYAMFAWIIMRIPIIVANNPHPNYFDPVVIIGGFMSHFYFTIPLGLTVKYLLDRSR